MSSKANPKLIGSFVLGGVGLLVAALIVFGSGTFAKKWDTWTVFFEGSVRGLNVGAPVTFRGITVGRVKEVFGMISSEELDIQVEVILEIDPQTIRDPLGLVASSRADVWERAQFLIDQGLRAKLETSSILTGQRFVYLDFYADTTMRVTGIEPRYPEIPTLPTAMEEMERALHTTLREISNLPLEDLVVELKATAVSVRELAGSAELDGLVTNLEEASSSLRQLAVAIEAEVDSAGMEMSQIGTELRKTLDQANRTLATMEGTAAEGSTLHYELTTTLKEFEKTARAVRQLAEYLEQHPEALITGKGDQK